MNPVFYVEYARVNEAGRSFREVVGRSEPEELEEPIDVLRKEIENELELKLTLSSDYRGWNFSENVIIEKNLSEGPWKYGYALGASRPLRLAASPDPCRFCLENFHAGAELYGGLGDSRAFGLSETAHYLAPVLLWRFSDSASVRVSPGFGLTDQSIPVLLRFGIIFEVPGLGGTP